MKFLERWDRGSRQIPPYVYGGLDKPEKQLCQGDVIRISGKLRLKFRQYYPGIRHPAFETKYALVLTQTCDLVPRKYPGESADSIGTPSALHVSLCPVRPVEYALNFEMKQMGYRDLNGHYLLPEDQHKVFVDRVSRLVNNSESKHLFFLPKYKALLPAHSVAVLSLNYPFRRELYSEILKNRVLSLRPEFRAKIGMIISEYYGRVATDDLLEECTDAGLTNIADYIVEQSKIINAHSSDVIQKLYKDQPQSRDEIERVKDDFLVQQQLKRINAIKKNINKFYSTKLFDALRNPERRAALAALSEIDLRKEVNALSMGVENHLVALVEDDE